MVTYQEPHTKYSRNIIKDKETPVAVFISIFSVDVGNYKQKTYQSKLANFEKEQACMNNFRFGIDQLTVAKVLAISDKTIEAKLVHDAVEKINTSKEYVEEIVANGETVYGINTGFGALADKKISEEDTRQLQYKILQSHSVGIGEPIPAEIARLMLLTKTHALAQGYSGVQLTTIERILWHVENDVIPVVPEKGSVGASGDLAPLAHLFLPLVGLGEVQYQGKKCKSHEVLNKFNLAH